MTKKYLDVVIDLARPALRTTPERQREDVGRIHHGDGDDAERCARRRPRHRNRQVAWAGGHVDLKADINHNKSQSGTALLNI